LQGKILSALSFLNYGRGVFLNGNETRSTTYYYPADKALDFIADKKAIAHAVIINCNPETRWLLFFDNNTGDTTGQAYRSYPLSGGNSIQSLAWAWPGLEFKKGIVWAFSQTPLTLQGGAAADCIAEIGVF
jgi:hypothetical protein